MLLIALLTIAGLGMLTNFPSKEDAFVTIRDAVVTTYFPGMSPDRVEDLIYPQGGGIHSPDSGSGGHLRRQVHHRGVHRLRQGVGQVTSIWIRSGRTCATR